MGLPPKSEWPAFQCWEGIGPLSILYKESAKTGASYSALAESGCEGQEPE